jgi:type II secretory ATPase GspE/PulE/Tfp pilus assembly ATPase PilB-like protein
MPSLQGEIRSRRNADGEIREYIKRFSITSFYRGKGCAACGFSGYRGRIGIFEVLPINHELRELIIKRASEDDMVTEARRTGFKR